MEFGLSKIILIDSYLPGRLYKIDTSGHTNIMGENDMGKTTLIKLAVLFYGERPNKLGIKKNEALKHHGFSEHYLPRSSSYVIFEYVVRGEPRMLVMTSSMDSKDSFKRTFVKSGFNESDFWIDGSVTPIKTDDFLKNVSQKYQVENCPSGEAQTRTLLDGRNHHFAMVPSRLNLTRMRQLMTSMFSRNAGHTELTKIIESWARGDLGADFNKNIDSITVSRNELETWVLNHKNHKSIKLHKERFNALNEALFEQKNNLAKAQGLYSLALERSVEFERQLVEQDSDFKTQSKSDEVVLLKKREERELLVSLYKEVNMKYLEIQSKIQALDSNYKSLIEKIPSDMDQLLLTAKSDLVQKKQIEEELKSINDGKNESTEWKTSQLAEAQSLFDVKITDLNASLKDVETQKYKFINQKIEELEQIFSGEIKELEATRDRLDKSLALISSQGAELRGKLATPSLSSEENKELRILEEQVLVIENAKISAERIRDDAISQRESSKKNYEDNYFELEVANKKLRDLEDNADELCEILNAQDGSLLSFLKKSVPNWQDTYGRTLRPEVLRSKNLSPALSENSIKNLVFDIEIDTNGLPEHYLELGDDDAIREQLEELSVEIQAIEKANEKLNNACLKASKEKDEAEIRVREAKISYDQKNRQYHTFRSDLTKERTRLDLALENHINKMNVELNELTEKYKDLSSKKSSLLKEISSLKAKHKTNRSNVEKSALEESSKKTNAIEDQINKASLTLSERIKSIEDQYKLMLDDKGFDGQYISNLNQQLVKIKERELACNKAISAKQTFDDFYNNDYALNTPVFRDDYSKFSDERSLSLEKITKKKIEIEKLEVSIEQRTHQHQITQSKSKRQLARINDDVLEYDRFNVGTHPYLDELYSVEQLCSHFTMYKNQLKTSTKQVSLINNELRPLFKVPGTGAFNYLASNPVNLDDPTQLAEKICSYLTAGYHEVDYRSFIQSTQNLERVNLYVDYLRQFKGKIRRYNTGLNKYMERAVAFNGIEHLEVDIVFQYADKNDWAMVSDVSEQYKNWKADKSIGSLDSSQVELPHDGLVEAIEVYLSTPNSDSMNVNELYKHIDFTIRFRDNGEDKQAHTFLDILSNKGGASSNGTSYLILITIFIGIINMMRKGNDVSFTWALDELADISPNNIKELLKLLSDSNINLISACTVASESVYLSFDKTYTIERDEATGNKVLTDEDYEDPLKYILESDDSKTQKSEVL